MSQMEPEVRHFLRKIIWTLSAALLWLLLNVLTGLKWGYAFFEKGHTLGSIIFYLWFAASLSFLLWLYHRWWKEHL